METFPNSYNLSTYLDTFLANEYDALKQLTEMSNEELRDVAADVNMTMKGHIHVWFCGHKKRFE